MPQVTYDFNSETCSIELAPGQPFDGEPCLIKLHDGWVQAYWQKQEIITTVDGSEADGFYWVCLDDRFTAELDEAKEWWPLPESNEAKERIEE